MNETKAAFAERTIQPSKKISLPLHGGFWIQVFTQTTSIYHYLKLWPKQFDRYETQNRKELRLYVYSLP